MKEKVIDKKDLKQVGINLYEAFHRQKFKGCLFIYDDNFSEVFERIKEHQKWISHV